MLHLWGSSLIFSVHSVEMFLWSELRQGEMVTPRYLKPLGERWKGNASGAISLADWLMGIFFIIQFVTRKIFQKSLTHSLFSQHSSQGLITNDKKKKISILWVQYLLCAYRQTYSSRVVSPWKIYSECEMRHRNDRAQIVQVDFFPDSDWGNKPQE